MNQYFVSVAKNSFHTAWVKLGLYRFGVCMSALTSTGHCL